MAIFPNLIVEPVVQVNDRTRLDASKSFVTQDEDAISSIEIRPSSSESFINVTTDKYLDWEYAASGTETITTRIIAGSATGEIETEIQVITANDDYLYSNDSDLQMQESDIMKWVKDGRNSYKDLHRRAQTLILNHLRKQGYVDVNGDPYTKEAIVDIEEVKQWSTFIVLRIIFDSISNAVDDVFAAKSKYYKGQEVEWRNQAVLRLDTDGDGVVDDGEQVDIQSGVVVRR